MTSASESSRQVANVALVFESGLVVLAVLIGRLSGRWPLPGIRPGVGGWEEHGWAAVWGLLGAVPMLLVLLLLERYPFGPLRGLQQTVEQKIVPFLREWTLAEMATISIAAGLGEEMLFRGLLQQTLADNIAGVPGIIIAVMVASALFGACHWVTASYAILAAAMGAYMGVLLLSTENLLTPIVTHAVYDFMALVYLTRGNVEKIDSSV